MWSEVGFVCVILVLYIIIVDVLLQLSSRDCYTAFLIVIKRIQRCKQLPQTQWVKELMLLEDEIESLWQLLKCLYPQMEIKWLTFKVKAYLFNQPIPTQFNKLLSLLYGWSVDKLISLDSALVTRKSSRKVNYLCQTLALEIAKV